MKCLLTLAAIAWIFASPAAGSEPAVPVMAPDYRSTLADYLPYREVPRADWRETNATVERLGGHMGHVREAGTGAGGAQTHHHGGGAGR